MSVFGEAIRGVRLSVAYDDAALCPSPSFTLGFEAEEWRVGNNTHML